MQPLVTVICLCYNHAPFLQEALDSVVNQTYKNLEIIIADDFSTDGSREIIAAFLKANPGIKYLAGEKNRGNCQAFNRAFAISRGKYIIDFATDDVLLPNRIEEQVAAFEQLDETYAVLYTDAELIDENGQHAGFFYQRNKDGSLKKNVPSGNVFADVLSRHFISTPTMIMRRTVLEKLGGYDETLAYEDFDFWVRSARDFKFYFLDKVLMKRRLHATQLSQQQYKPHDKQLFSTIKVCEKAKDLVRNEIEKAALILRIENEMTQAVFTKNQKAIELLYQLLNEFSPVSGKAKSLYLISKLPLPLAAFRKFYYKLRYGR